METNMKKKTGKFGGIGHDVTRMALMAFAVGMAFTFGQSAADNLSSRAASAMRKPAGINTPTLWEDTANSVLCYYIADTAQTKPGGPVPGYGSIHCLKKK